MKRRLWIVMLVLVALLAPTTNALAGNGGDDSGKVVFGGDFVLEEGWSWEVVSPQQVRSMATW